jgi:hypothetical protein
MSPEHLHRGKEREGSTPGRTYSRDEDGLEAISAGRLTTLGGESSVTREEEATGSESDMVSPRIPACARPEMQGDSLSIQAMSVVDSV